MLLRETSNRLNPCDLFNSCAGSLFKGLQQYHSPSSFEEEIICLAAALINDDNGILENRHYGLVGRWITNLIRNLPGIFAAPQMWINGFDPMNKGMGSLIPDFTLFIQRANRTYPHSSTDAIKKLICPPFYDIFLKNPLPGPRIMVIEVKPFHPSFISTAKRILRRVEQESEDYSPLNLLTLLRDGDTAPVPMKIPKPEVRKPWQLPSITEIESSHGNETSDQVDDLRGGTTKHSHPHDSSSKPSATNSHGASRMLKTPTIGVHLKPAAVKGKHIPSGSQTKAFPKKQRNGKNRKRLFSLARAEVDTERHRETDDETDADDSPYQSHSDDDTYDPQKDGCGDETPQRPPKKLILVSLEEEEKLARAKEDERRRIEEEIREDAGKSQEITTLKELEAKLMHKKLRDAQAQATIQAKRAMWKASEQEIIIAVAFTGFYWSHCTVRRIKTGRGVMIILDDFTQAGNLLSPESDAEEQYLRELLCAAGGYQYPGTKGLQSTK
jgi:hypothetical protein